MMKVNRNNKIDRRARRMKHGPEICTYFKMNEYIPTVPFEKRR